MITLLGNQYCQWDVGALIKKENYRLAAEPVAFDPDDHDGYKPSHGDDRTFGQGKNFVAQFAYENAFTLRLDRRTDLSGYKNWTPPHPPTQSSGTAKRTFKGVKKPFDKKKNGAGHGYPSGTEASSSRTKPRG